MREIIPLICGLAAVVVAISAHLKSYYVSKASIEYERRFTKLETQAELFYKVIERDIGNMIHSPHREELDKLIEKNNDPKSQLTKAEAIRIIELLDEILELENPSNNERFGITVYKASIISRNQLTIAI